MLVVTEIYRFKIVHFLLIYGLWNRDHITGHLQTRCAYSLYLDPSCAQISTFLVQQIYCYKRINKFSTQKWQFYLKFRVSKSRSRDLGSSKLTYMMLLSIVILYPKFNFSTLSRLLVTSKSITFSTHLSKSPSSLKTKVLRARARSSNQIY